MKKLHFTLMLFFASLMAMAQSVTIQGIVSSPAGPVANQVVVVRYDSLTVAPGFLIDSVVTNANGFYTITNIPATTNPFIVAEVSTFACGVNVSNILFTSNANVTLTSDLSVCSTTGCFAFFSSAPVPNTPNTFQFTSGATPANLNHTWDFGDSTTSTAVNPVKTYTSNGVYFVHLIVSNAAGTCIDTFVSQVNVGASVSCQADFNYNVSTTNPLSVSFTNTSTAAANATYTWSFGDGTTATGLNQTKVFSNPGFYFVCLTVQSGACVDQICQGVSVGSGVVNVVAGFVLLDTNNIQISHPFEVFLIEYDSIAGTLTPVDTFYSSANTSPTSEFFSFSNINAGVYFVKAALRPNHPQFANFMPTYSGQTLTWNSADMVIASNSTGGVTLTVINLIPGINPGGPAFVGGFVSQGANRTTGQGLKDYSVVIINNQGEPVAHALTDIDGKFEWPSLPFGSYQVFVEVPGKPSVMANVVLNSNNTIVDNLQFEVNSSNITLFTNKNNTIKDLKLFPNPAQNQLFISFDCEGTKAAAYQIVNNKGQVVANQSINLNNGCNTNFEVNIEQLTSGLYFLRISADEKVGNIKFIKQ